MNVAAGEGTVEIVKCLRRKGVQWSVHTAISAALGRNHVMLRFLVETSCPTL